MIYQAIAAIKADKSPARVGTIYWCIGLLFNIFLQNFSRHSAIICH
jgi:hypothetical protein